MAEIIPLRPAVQGDGAVINCDDVLAAQKGALAAICLIGIDHDGGLVVAGSHSAAESAFLMARATAYLVGSEVGRS